MKQLTIRYGDITVFDGQVDEFRWTDNADEVTVVGRIRRAKPASGLLDVLTGLSKAKTEAKRESYGESIAPVNGVEAEGAGSIN